MEYCIGITDEELTLVHLSYLDALALKLTHDVPELASIYDPYGKLAVILGDDGYEVFQRYVGKIWVETVLEGLCLLSRLNIKEYDAKYNELVKKCVNKLMRIFSKFLEGSFL